MGRDPDRLPDADTPEGNLAALHLYFGITEEMAAEAEAILAEPDSE